MLHNTHHLMLVIFLFILPFVIPIFSLLFIVLDIDVKNVPLKKFHIIFWTEDQGLFCAYNILFSLSLIQILKDMIIFWQQR